MAGQDELTVEVTCKKYGITTKDLEVEISEGGLLCLQKYLTKWDYLIASRLGFTESDISDIKYEHPRQAEKQRVSFLRSLKNKMPHKYMYHQLIGTLWDCGEKGNADSAIQELTRLKILPVDATATQSLDSGITVGPLSQSIDSNEVLEERTPPVKRSLSRESSDSESSPPAKRAEYFGLLKEGEKVLDITPPLLNEYNMEDRNAYFCDIEDQYVAIKTEFFDLILALLDSLRGINLSLLREFFMEYISQFGGQGPEEDSAALSKLKRAEKFDDIYFVVGKYYSFCNFDMLEKLVSVHGNDTDKKNLDEYIKKFKRCVLTVHNNRVICGRYIPGQKLVSFKILPAKELHGTEVEKVKRNLSKILQVPRARLNLKQIRQGCLEFDFLVPENSREQLFRLSEQDKKEMSALSITFIEAYYSSDELLATESRKPLHVLRRTDGFLSKYRSRISAALSSQVKLLDDANSDRPALTSLLKPKAQDVAFDSSDEITTLSPNEAKLKFEEGTQTGQPYPSCHYELSPLIQQCLSDDSSLPQYLSPSFEYDEEGSSSSSMTFSTSASYEAQLNLSSDSDEITIETVWSSKHQRLAPPSRIDESNPFLVPNDGDKSPPNGDKSPPNIKVKKGVTPISSPKKMLPCSNRHERAAVRILPNGFLSKRTPPSQTISDNTQEKCEAEVLPSKRPNTFRKTHHTTSNRRQQSVLSMQKENFVPILKIIGKKFRKTYIDFDSSDSESD